MYTVTFQDANDGQEKVSRFFETVRAARNWAKWLGNQNFTRTVAIYRGQAGEMLLQRLASTPKIARYHSDALGMVTIPEN